MKKYVEKTEVIDGVEYITNFDERAECICIPTNYVKYWHEKLSMTEFSIAYALSDFINRHDNSLKIKQKYLNLKDIALQLNYKYDTIRKIIPQLIKQNVLCQYYINIYDNKYIKVYILNPSIAFCEDELDDEIINIFNDKRLIEINNALYSGSSDRNTLDYKNWVLNCLERDSYCCQRCGSNKNLQVHHVLNYSSHKKLRTDVNNGITLCERCHSPIISGSFHQIYGTYNNTKEQLDEYINSYNK